MIEKTIRLNGVKWFVQFVIEDNQIVVQEIEVLESNNNLVEMFNDETIRKFEIAVEENLMGL